MLKCRIVEQSKNHEYPNSFLAEKYFSSKSRSTFEYNHVKLTLYRENFL